MPPQPQPIPCIGGPCGFGRPLRPEVLQSIQETVTPLGKKHSTLRPDPVIEAYKKDIDLTLIRENLKLSVEERLLKLIELQRFAEELRRAGRVTWKPLPSWKRSCGRKATAPRTFDRSVTREPPEEHPAPPGDAPMIEVLT